jgi:hypothetical protein
VISERRAEHPTTHPKKGGAPGGKEEPQDANNDRDNNYSLGRYGFLVVDSFVYSGERVAWDLAMGSRVG